MPNPDVWLNKLRKLRVDRAKNGPAPHKPLMLLVLMDLAEQNMLPAREIPLTPELAFRFCTYWGIVAHRRTQRPDVRLPFHHLQSDGLWTAFGEDRKPSPDNRLTRYVFINQDFDSCIHDTTFRDKARRTLISTYFQEEERIAFYSLLDLPIPTDDELASIVNQQPPEAAIERGRESRFRLNIVAAYNYTCALTGYRLLTVSSGSIIDAAHIHQFADSRNNDVRNGLALCKNAHWLFDNGLWTIADDYTVIVAKGSFAEDSPDQRSLTEYDGQKIRLPSDPLLHPNPVHLGWHRKRRFQGRA